MSRIEQARLAEGGGGDLEADVATIEIDKVGLALRAYDAAGNLLAFYPATIGSSEAPAPRVIPKKLRRSSMWIGGKVGADAVLSGTHSLDGRRVRGTQSA